MKQRNGLYLRMRFLGWDSLREVHGTQADEPAVVVQMSLCRRYWLHLRGVVPPVVLEIATAARLLLNRWELSCSMPLLREDSRPGVKPMKKRGSAALDIWGAVAGATARSASGSCCLICGGWEDVRSWHMTFRISFM